MTGEGRREQAEDAAAATFCTAESGSAAAESMEPVPKKQKSDCGGDDDVRYGTVSYVLTEDEHITLLQLEQTYPKGKTPRTAPPKIPHGKKWTSIAAEMLARFPDLKVKRQGLRGICMRGKTKRELHKLRGFKKEHEGPADVKTKEGAVAATAEQQQELKALKERVEVLEKENKEIHKQLENAEKHVVVLKKFLEVEKSEKADFKFQLRSEKRKVAVFGKQLHAANTATTELRRMLYEDVEDDEDTQETQGPEEAEG